MLALAVRNEERRQQCRDSRKDSAKSVQEVKAMAGEAGAMDKSKVIRILEFFPDINEEIRAKRSAIADLDQCYSTVSGIQYDGMPKGNFHAGSQTENRAMHIPDYLRKEIKMYQREIEILQKVKIEIIKEVSRLNLKHKKSFSVFTLTA